MAEFKVAEAYADFHVNVDKGIDAAVARLKARAKDLDIKLTATLDADITAARAKMAELLKDAKVNVKADADTTQAKAKIKELEASDGKVEIKADVDRASLNKTSRVIDDAMSQVAGRANAKFSALAFTALSVGLPAAAAVGVAGVGVALAAVPALFAGLGIAVAAQNEAVSARMSAMADHVQTEVERMSEQFERPLVQAVGMVGQAFDRAEPLISQAMRNSTQAVEPLVGAVTDAAENALPGMVKATAQLTPVMEGVRSMAGQVGTGVGQMFANMTEGAAGASQGMTTLGGIFRDALSFIGTFFAQVANGSAGPLNQLQTVLGQVYAILLNLTAQGSAAISFLTGFTSAGIGMLSTVNAIVAGLSILPQGLTQFGGSLAATAMLASKFGVDVGAAFSGLGDKIKAADGPREKFSAGMAGLVAGALSPATVAVGVVSYALSELGRRQQEAAAKAAAHAREIESLTTALQRDGGAVGDATRAVVAKGLADKNAANNAQALGVSMGLVTNAANGSTGAMVGLVAQYNSMIDGFVKSGAITQAETGSLRANADQLAKTGGAASDVANSFAGLSWEQQNQITASQNLIGAAAAAVVGVREVKKANDEAKIAALENAGAMGELGGAMYEGVPAATPLAQALKTVRDSAATADTAISALQTALDILNGRAPAHEEAIQAIQDGIRNLGEEFGKGVDKAKGWGQALINNDGTVNTAKENGSKLQDQMVGLQQAFAAAGLSTEDLMRKGMSYNDASAQVRTELEGQRAAFITVAEKMGLTAAQANTLANKYGLIPNEVMTIVGAPGLNDRINEAETYAAKLRNIPSQINSYVTTYYNSVGSATVGSPSTGYRTSTSGRVASAEGNMLKFFASGGFNSASQRATQMAQGFATVVPKRTDRRVGDNPTYDESYIPLNPKSSRAQGILDKTNDIMRPGWDEHSSSGSNITINLYAQPEQDIHQLASLVSREIALASTAGGAW